MKKFLFASIMVGATLSALAATTDTLRTVELQNVTVTSTRATSKTPIAFNNLDREQINQVNLGKDMPAVLNMLPRVTMSSDAGMGVGYTGIHVRGTDPTRINVTANGIPLNDAESSQLYWVNMGDFASSAQSIQLQRGVGTSTNGAGAFGATVNILTENVGLSPYFAVNLTAGSYGTNKETVRFSTGVLGGHWSLQGRLSHIGSDGYIARASSRLNSYFLQAGYFSDRTLLKFITFNGAEKTYMAWDYLSRADMEKYGRNYNPCGKYTAADGSTAFYRNQTDNYHQQHYQLHWNQLLGDRWNLNLALHYTRGDGYYEQYKSDQKLYKYLIAGGTRADLVRRKHMGNDFYGAVGSINYDNNGKLTLNLGGGWNKYDGNHWGKVIWLGDRYYYDDDYNKVYVPGDGTLDPDHRYYDNNAKKTDGNIFAKATCEIFDGFNAFIDLQYRHVGYKMSGTSQEFDDNKAQRPLVLDRKYDFFNPKFGFSYRFLDNHTAYASYAIAHKEPTRNDFEDMLAQTEEVDPQAERLNDLEIGYRWETPTLRAGINFYYMDYYNQFVLTGAQDSNGEMVARNIRDSYRMGAEITAGWQPFKGFNWDFNVTLSRNRARNMSLTVINEDWSQSSVDVGSTRLAFSPSVILGNSFSYRWKGLRAALFSKYVSRQRMTNSGFDSYLEDDGSYTSALIDAAFTTDLELSYTFSIKSVKEITVGVTVYNLFNEKYDSNGSCSMNFRTDAATGKVVAYNGGWAWATFSPQAPTHFLARLSLRF